MLRKFEKMMNDTNDYVILAILLVFILFDVQVPYVLAQLVNHFLGKLFVVLLVIAMIYINPIVGIVAAVAAHELFHRSKLSAELDAKDRYLHSEEKKAENVRRMNVGPKDNLELEMVQKMKRTRRVPLRTPDYLPMESKVHNASTL
tara:strand:- start:11381 stop:11818 length:438 start_codon:yes stop_codon:yes gene_type:complete